jgi:glycosyltransferase involved in cell wall biosynthesis
MRILFVHNSLRTFVRFDRDILASEHDVDEMDFSVPARIVSLPWRLARADLLFIWFASLHSFFPALLGRAAGKPVISVVGAYDAANIPEINFGHMGHPWKRYVVRSICGASTVLVCNSEYARATVEQNIRPRAPIRVIPHGVQFPPLGQPEREPLVLTVGQIRRVNLARKGLEVFAQAAALVPEARFVIVGEIMDGSADYLRAMGPANLEIRDEVPQAELEDLYARASVYVQASVHESFGLTVVESMAAGDVPVVSRRGSLPEVAGPDAIFVDETDPKSVADGIRQGLQMTGKARRVIATYARERFPLENRRRSLIDLVAEFDQRR